MNTKSTYHAKVNGVTLHADTLIEIRQKVKSFIETTGSSWGTVQGLYREKNGKIFKIGNR